MDRSRSRQTRDAVDEVRAYTADELKAAVLGKLKFIVGKDPVAASQRDWFLSVARGDPRHRRRALDRLDQPQSTRISASASIISASSS